MDRIEVESKSFVQPYYYVPAVRFVLRPRTQKERRTNQLYAGRAFWFKANTWGVCHPKYCEEADAT